MTRAVGVDPGLHGGIAVVERAGSSYRVVSAVSVDTDAASPLPTRMWQFWTNLDAVVRGHRPDVLGSEIQEQAQYGQQLRGGGNINAMRVMRISGIAAAVAFAWRCHYVELSPQQVKIAVLGPGSSRAEKSAVKAAVERFKWEPGCRSNEHSRDAVAIAVGAMRRWELSALCPDTGARVT